MGGTLLTLMSARALVENGRLSPGGYASMVMLTGQFLWPIATMGQVFERYQKAAASVGRVFEVMDVQPAVLGGDLPLPTSEVRGDIVFSDVSFHYPSGRTVLRHTNITIPAGSTVAVVGATGCGKTTLMKLLLRFHEPQSGAIAIDGMPIDQIDVRDLRSAIGLVSQDVFLFDGSVLENVRFGAPSASMEKVEHACQIASILNFIRELPEGFHTRIGERGVKLSWGQRQRLSIARAVLRRSPVLVLDEGTSALDHETEAAIYRSLNSEFADATLVIIAHRLSTIRNCDRIFYLESGRVVEQGTHEELVEAQGRYATALSFAGAGLDEDEGENPG
jgi:ATP-binding cassette subfamily B protein